MAGLFIKFQELHTIQHTYAKACTEEKEKKVNINYNRSTMECTIVFFRSVLYYGLYLRISRGRTTFIYTDLEFPNCGHTSQIDLVSHYM